MTAEAAGRPAGDDVPASRFLTSLRMQAAEYRHRLLLLLLVMLLPVTFFAATYYSTRTEPSPIAIEVPGRTGVSLVRPPERETWPVSIGLMGVSWAVAAAAFFSVTGNLQKDRRLVLAGYRAWELLLARLTILAVFSVALAFSAMLIFTGLASSNHPWITWVAAFLAGLIAAGVGLLLGTLLPRPTEGMLLIIMIFGVGMSLGQDAGRYFFMHPTQQLLTVGRFSQDPWPYPYIWQGLLVAAAFVAGAVLLWWLRTRIPRRPLPEEVEA